MPDISSCADPDTPTDVSPDREHHRRSPPQQESLRAASLLRRAQSGSAREVLDEVEPEMREATGDLADGAAALHFARVVALERLHPDVSALPAADLFVAAALREMSGWLSCAYSMRAICLLDHGGSPQAGTGAETAVHDLASAEATLVSVEADIVQTCNAHADLGVAYEMLRLYELAGPHYEAAHASSLQVMHGAVRPVLWSMNLAGLHLVWGLELYRVNSDVEATEHISVAAEHALRALDEARADEDEVVSDMANLRLLCARADGDADLHLVNELRRAIERGTAQESAGTIAVAESFYAVALSKTGQRLQAIQHLNLVCRRYHGAVDAMTEAALTHTRAVLLAQDGREDAQATLTYGDVLAQLLWQDRLRTLTAARTTRELESLRQQHQDIALAASTDPLTGLANRRALDELVARLTAQDGAAVGVLVVDVDKFKQINDTLGHDAGDVALRTIASVLTTSVRAGDLVARTGGDEFAVLLPDATMQTAAAVADRIVRTVTSIDDCIATVSIGVAVVAGRHLSEALQAADSAMYEAKRAGGNGAHLAS